MKISKFAMVTTAMVSVLAIAPNALAQDQGGEADEIIVTGIKSSIEQSLNVKRNASSVVDSINAEDLGKFPDANVAESLQRITGVAITRARGGEGRFVTVRGLGEEFNNVTYNGRTLATENLGREFSFDVIASELISRADVFKSSEASHADGSIGGLINVVSAKPLDKPGFRAAGSIAAEHDNLADSTGMRASGVVSNTFADDTVGLLASFAYHQRDVRSDTYESIDYRRLNLVNRGGGNGLTGLSVFDAAQDSAADIVSNSTNSTYSAGINREERERIGGTLALQYEPSDTVSVIADVLYTKYQSPGESSFTTAYFAPPADGSISIARVNGPITAWRSDNFISDYVARSFKSDTDTIQLGLNADWEASDRLRFNMDAAWSKAEGRRDNNGSGVGGGNFLVLGIQGARGSFEELGRVDRLTVEVPTYDPTVVGNFGPDGNRVTGGAGAGYVDISQADPRLFDAHFNRVSEYSVEDTVTSLQLKGAYDVNDSTVLSFGVDYTDREKSNVLEFNNQGQVEFCCYGANFASLNPGLFPSFASPLQDNYLGGLAPQGFLAFSASDFRDYFAPYNVGSFGSLGLGVNAGLAETNIGVLDGVVDLAASNTVQEQILGGFVQMNIAGELSGVPYEANAGVRVAKTDLKSIGHQAQIESISVGADMIAQQFALTEPLPISIPGSYTNFLPSANIKFDLTDNMVLRMAASKTLSRPTLTDLSTQFSVTSQNIGTETITQGNPGLEAPTSTNLDVSLEYYGDNGLSFNGALFNKSIDGFVANRRFPGTYTFRELQPQNLPAGLTPGVRVIDTNQPTNAESATITGVELGAQYLTEMGFGVQGNVTFVETNASFEGEADTQLENVSPVSWNLSAFYEKDRITARVSYNFREGYLATTAGLQNRSEFTDDYGQLDFAAAFDVTDNFAVFLEGVNLTEEASYTYSEDYSVIRNYEENGRRIIGGVRAKF